MLTLYNKTLGELVTREGVFVVVIGWFLLSTRQHLLCFWEGQVELWLMPRDGEWYNLSSSWQNWNQLSYFVPTQLLSWGGKKSRQFHAAIENKASALSLRFTVHKCHQLELEISQLRCYLWREVGGAELARDTDVILDNKWAVASLGLRGEFYLRWWWIICMFKFSCKLNGHENLSGYSCFHTRCSSLVLQMY